MPVHKQVAPLQQNGRILVLVAVGALGVSCVMTQLALMRELLAAFSGNEMVFGIVLGLWLLLMGIGTWLGRVSERIRAQLSILAILQILVAVLPLLQVFLLRALRNLVFIRGAAVGAGQTMAGVSFLLLPYCLPAGFALTLSCSILARREGSAGIGRAYVADSIGSIIGGIVFSFVLVRFLDHSSILLWPAFLNLGVACATGFLCGRRSLSLLASVLGAGLLALMVFADLDGISTGLQYPRQRIVARANSPYGKLVITESDGQFDFFENGLPAISTRDDQHVEEVVHYAMSQRPDARKVLLVSGGISGTAREILKYNVARVDYVELDPAILEFGRKYLPENLADSRIRIINGDGRLFIKKTLDKYDVVIIDVPAPSTALLNRFYTVEFLADVKRALVSDGVVSFSLGRYENYVSREMTRILSSARLSSNQSFRNILAIPGSRIFFLASDGPLFSDIAARIEQRGIKTRLVNHHYLDAMMTPDRMADLAHAAAQPVPLNQNFSPVLYYYYLRHWMSQFDFSFGPLQAALLLLLGFYIARLRGSALVLFASGFAASALEVVLLLAFQVLCGSVYHQVGIIVTVFMIGLALGALAANRLFNPVGDGGSVLVSPSTQENTGLRDPVSERVLPVHRMILALLACALTAYAILLPLLLPWLNRMGGSDASLLALKVLISVLTLVLAFVVGMQFPLANRVEFDGTGAGASKLYAADFVGASLGALLACTFLIPLLGVAGVCWLAAALNLLAGAMMRPL